jgi:hypothetical protein
MDVIDAKQAQRTGVGWKMPAVQISRGWGFHRSKLRRNFARTPAPNLSDVGRILAGLSEPAGGIWSATIRFRAIPASVTPFASPTREAAQSVTSFLVRRRDIARQYDKPPL